MSFEAIPDTAITREFLTQQIIALGTELSNEISKLRGENDTLKNELNSVKTELERKSNDLIFNESKTVCMYFLNQIDAKCCVSFPNVYINSKEIERVTKFKYLGQYICESLSDDDDIRKQIQLNYARANMLTRTFKYCSLDVKCLLFKTYMYSQYCCCLWNSFSNNIYAKLVVSYNNSFRSLMKYPIYCSASGMFVENRIMTYKEITRLNCARFLNRIMNSSMN